MWILYAVLAGFALARAIREWYIRRGGNRARLNYFILASVSCVWFGLNVIQPGTLSMLAPLAFMWVGFTIGER